MRLMRRTFLLGFTGACITGVAIAQTQNLTVQDTHTRVKNGTLILIDIRQPKEWKSTGIALGATPIDMRRRDFVDRLLEATNGQTDAPIALICAAGGRSTRLRFALMRAGFSDVYDVPEGMLGSRAGPGWVRSGLPVVPYN